MIPYDPFALSAIWYTSWRGHIASAKAHPEENKGYCWAACIANAEFVLNQALEIARAKKASKP